MVAPFIGVAVFAIIALNVMGSGFSMWWIILVFGFPLIRKVIRMLKKNLGG